MQRAAYKFGRNGIEYAVVAPELSNNLITQTTDYIIGTAKAPLKITCICGPPAYKDHILWAPRVYFPCY